MKKIKTYFNILFVMLAAIMFIACPDVFQPPIMDNGNGVSENGNVRIYIGESNSTARTVYPDSEFIEGYQLTFSGAETKAPVNITEGNSIDVFLPNGTWIITATAYKLGGTIGNANDAIASGSITISISNGVVSGTVPPIILTQGGSTGNGTLNYKITFGSDISGFMKLWHTDGNFVNAFGDNGELSLSNSVDIDFNLAAGRYIAEVRLTNIQGNVAFYREVIEIWKDTKTILIFTPTDFYDPSIVPQEYEYGDFSVISNNHAIIIYTEGVLNITGNGDYTIGMRSGVTGTIAERIVVATGVTANITLTGVNINLSSISRICAFDMTGATVNLTLVGDNVLRSGSDRAGLETPQGSTLVITEASTGTVTATGGINGAGIGGDYGGTGGTISISGGTVMATGSNGAGIGGGYYGAGGTISISGGTVTATGSSGTGIGGGSSGAGGTISISGGTVTAYGSYGAGIGGGNYGAGGTISISGGTVTATGSNGGAGIGGGYQGAGGTISTISGNAVVIASSITAELPTGSNLGPAIVFNGANGIMYGNVTLARNVTIPSNRILGIGNTLTIENGYMLTNNGIIVKNSGNIIGTITGNQPVEPAFTVSGGSAYTYPGGVLTITGNGTYTIGMRSGVTSTTAERIVVATGVTANITLTGVNIDVSSISNTCAFDMTGATVNLTLVGDNVLRSVYLRAGLEAPEGSTLVITETSTGTLAATGGQFGAGIGGGAGGAGGTISISGGTVTATGSNGVAGIGGGNGGAGGTISTISGNAVVIASSITAELPTGSNLGPAIVFNGANGIMYGNVTLARNVTIPSGRILSITNGRTLTIQSGYTLTNNGRIIIENGSYTGTITGNQPMEPAFTVSGGSAYTYTEGVLTITGNGTYTIGMRNGVTSTTAERIVVATGVTANITLTGVNINLSSISRICAFDMTGATVNLTLVGDNVLRSGAYRAGLETPQGSTLVITEASTGTVTATGGSWGAGIGGGSNGAGGTISISGGTVTATGNSYGAGIGGGDGGAGGTISISGGTVTATGSSYGAGIGGDYYGAGIGGGRNGAGGTISTVSGNAVVFATSITAELPTGSNLGPAIVFNGNNGTMYGNVTLARNVTIPYGRVLSITNGRTLTIQSGYTLTNNGTIIIENGSYTGTITGNQPEGPAVWN